MELRARDEDEAGGELRMWKIMRNEEKKTRGIISLGYFMCGTTT
jgi:hypothetical protein